MIILTIKKLKRFSYKKIVLLGLVLPMMLAGCNSRNQRDSYAVASVDTVQVFGAMNSEMRYKVEQGIVLEQVKNIYNVVRADYMIRGGVFDSDLFDKSYCSKSWNKLLLQVRCKEQRTNTLFYEINPWSMTCYSGMIVNFDEFEVTDLVIEPEKKASVSFTVYEDDAYTPARIDLVYEDGHWVIDNFYNLKYMLDVRNCMQQYLAHDIV
jgi:hypothetical protein